MKVGVFDSGLGGLTILKSVVEKTPQYDFLYLGDSARSPYGSRDFDTILEWTWQAVQYLFAQDCHLVLLACNTASAKALRTIQQRYLPKFFPERRVLGVIRPSVEYLRDTSHSHTVGIWATEGTVASRSYLLEFQHYAPQIKAIQCACPLLVPHIEQGNTPADTMREIISNYWKATQAQNSGIDVLLLACTHFPLLFHQIREVIPPHISLVHQGMIVGEKWQDYLFRHPEHGQKLSAEGTIQFQTTGDTELFNRLIKNYSDFTPNTLQVNLT